MGYSNQKNPLLWEKGANQSSTTGAAPANVTSELSNNDGRTNGSASNQSKGFDGKYNANISNDQTNTEEISSDSGEMFSIDDGNGNGKKKEPEYSFKRFEYMGYSNRTRKS